MIQRVRKSRGSSRTEARHTPDRGRGGLCKISRGPSASIRLCSHRLGGAHSTSIYHAQEDQDRDAGSFGSQDMIIRRDDTFVVSYESDC